MAPKHQSQATPLHTAWHKKFTDVGEAAKKTQMGRKQR